MHHYGVLLLESRQHCCGGSSASRARRHGCLRADTSSLPQSSLDRVRLVPRGGMERGEDVGGFSRGRGGRGELVAVDADRHVA